ncbi:MAG: hypothetical protein K6G73_12450 [Marinilabiliaceae bacterium]|nr:hypothetical protein [Marinilabiliaceae bacterium]
MKRLIILLFGVVLLGSTFASCDDDEGTKWDKNAKLYIQGVDRTNKNIRYAVESAMTAAEICRLDTIEIFLPEYNALLPFGEPFDNKIDTVNNRLVMVGANIETVEDNPFFISEECIIVSGEEYDTLAYVPYAQRQAAYEQIKPLWDTENWDAIYEIFQNAFTFIPCTGAEYKALKEQGLN